MASNGSTFVSAGQSVRVRHAQTHWSVGPDLQVMNVHVQRVGSSGSVAVADFRGTFSNLQNWTPRINSSGGTYRLRFIAPNGAANINGQFQTSICQPGWC